MNFSVVCLAKNEEKTLPRLVNSLKEFQEEGGEICILDTGSTDNTVRLATELGCKVTEVGDRFVKTITNADEINKRFIDREEPIIKNGDKMFDFGSARNFAATLASNDMVAMPDPDEIYTTFDLDKVEEASKKSNQLEYNFVFSHDQYGNEAIKFTHCKFYNRTKLHWENIIHEVLQGESKRTFLGEDIIKLEHFQQHKAERGNYLPGLALDCFNNQDNDRNSHYLARELLWANRPKSAIKEFKRHIKMNGWVSERAQSMIYIADAHRMLSNASKAVEWYHKAFDLDASRREAPMRLARHYYELGDAQRTACYCSLALEIPWNGFYANQHAHYAHEPHELLYWATWELGDKAKSKYHFDAAIKYQPYNPKYLTDTSIYYEYPDNKIEGWMRFPELQFLYNTSKKMKTICEVGSWKGKSTHALLSGCKGKVTAVDHFKGSDNEQGVHAEGKTDKVYDAFVNNTKEFKHLTINRKDSLSAAKDYKDKEFDMVFIDAGHTYEEVVKDIRAWRGKAKVLLCGHDFSPAWKGVMKAVRQEIGEPDGIVDSVWYKWVDNMTPMPMVSIVIPTLDRPEKLKRLLGLIEENAYYPNYEVIVKQDKFPPNNTGAPKLVKQGTDESKGELVMFLGDDVIPYPGFLRKAIERMHKEFGDEMDGLIGLNDMYWHGEMATHWLASKKLLPMLGGEFFHTGYFHTGCDNELTERCRNAGKYVWAEEAIVYHDHPLQTGFKEIDDVYKLAYRKDRMEHDRDLLYKRSKKLGFKLKENFTKPKCTNP